MVGKQGVHILFCAVALVVFGCSSKKQTRPASVPPEPVIIDEAPVLAVTEQENVVKDTVLVLVHGNFPTQPFRLFETLSPDQQAQQQYMSGQNRNYGFAPTIHYDLRRPQFVMIHHTAQNSLEQTIRTFQLPHTKVSSHYVIGRNGQVVQMLNDYMRGWHAGSGKWGNITDMNAVSIGIELDNNGKEPYPTEQINALLTLLDTLKTKYRIPQKNFIGHSDFAPGRKDDPNSFFPWEVLAERGFGIWHNESYLVAPPPTFNTTDALRIIGYDTSNLRAAIQAFKRKFIRVDISPELTPYDVMVIYDLYRKFY